MPDLDDRTREALIHCARARKAWIEGPSGNVSDRDEYHYALDRLYLALAVAVLRAESAINATVNPTDAILALAMEPRNA